MATLSVCLTHYDRPHLLGETLRTLAEQTRRPDEIFLWDDCSPNDPAPVVERWRHRFKSFVYHRNERNLNMPGNLNAVLAQATGDYIANLHDADRFDPTLLEKWERMLEAHPTAGFVFCGYDARHGAKNGRVWVHRDVECLTSGRDFFEKHYLYQSSSKIWGTVMARREVYANLLPFNERFRNWADVDMWMRICLRWSVAYVPEPLICTDNSETPMRKFSWFRALVIHEMVMQNIHRFYADDPARRDAALARQLALARWRVCRHLFSRIRVRDWTGLRTGFRVVPWVLSAKPTKTLLSIAARYESRPTSQASRAHGSCDSRGESGPIADTEADARYRPFFSGAKRESAIEPQPPQA